MEAALEAGASDVVSNDDSSVDVLTNPADYQGVKDAMMSAGLEPDEAEVTMRANVLATLEGDDAQKCLRLLDMLEELDDTQNVYSNADFPEDVLEQLDG
jgi:transcriptional/translational regulatory protein YebC/TACO1